MAIELATQVRISRPAQLVFTELTALDRWPEWLVASGIRSVELLDGRPLGTGSALRIRQEAAGRTATIDATVTLLEPPMRFALTGRDADGITTEIEARIGQDGPIAVVDWRVVVKLPLRLRMFEGLAAPQLRKAVYLDLEAFRRRLESVAHD